MSSHIRVGLFKDAVLTRCVRGGGGLSLLMPLERHRLDNGDCLGLSVALLLNPKVLFTREVDGRFDVLASKRERDANATKERWQRLRIAEC